MLNKFDLSQGKKKSKARFKLKGEKKKDDETKEVESADGVETKRIKTVLERQQEN